MGRLAIFDLDYTLTRRGTWGRFIAQSMKGQLHRVPGLLVAAGWTQWRYKAGALPRIAVKTAMMRHSVQGWQKDRLEALADRFVQSDLETGMDSRVLAAFHRHQADGDTVLIASAAVDVLVERYAAALGADGQVSTIMAWTDDGRLAGHFGSENCYGENKLVRIRDWLSARGETFDHVSAYSDSRSDAPMLEFADRAVIIAPDKKTRRYAERHGFDVWERDAAAQNRDKA